MHQLLSLYGECMPVCTLYYPFYVVLYTLYAYKYATHYVLYTLKTRQFAVTSKPETEIRNGSYDSHRWKDETQR